MIMIKERVLMLFFGDSYLVSFRSMMNNKKQV